MKELKFLIAGFLISCIQPSICVAQEMYLAVSIGNFFERHGEEGRLDKINYWFDQNEFSDFVVSTGFVYHWKNRWIASVGISYFEGLPSLNMQRNDTTCFFCPELNIRGGGYIARTLRVPVTIAFDILRQKDLSLCRSRIQRNGSPVN